MLVSFVHKFIYYAPVKTGSTSVATILTERFAAELYGYKGQLWPRHHMFLPADLSDFFTFVTVRNPYTRFLSAFNFFTSNPNDTTYGITIDQFCQLGWYKPVAEELHDRNIKANEIPIRIDAVLRLEYINNDFHLLPFVTQKVAIPVRNRSGNLINYLPKHVIDYIANRHHIDFETYGYDKRPPVGCMFKML